jgi:hypothetical protein
MAAQWKTKVVGWQSMMKDAERRLKENTGQGKAAWLTRIDEADTDTEAALRRWLTGQGVGGYSQDLLVYERFGYPEFMLTDPETLIDEQYADREDLRPVCDAVLDAAAEVGDVVVQARKTYVSLMTPRRAFAIVKASTKSRVDLGLNLPNAKPGGRLEAAKSLPKGTVRVGLSSLNDVDSEVVQLLRQAYTENS